MKKCLFCAEEIQEEALKCKHCGEFLDKKEKSPWYFSSATLVIAILSLGPLALPLLWFNPKYSRTKKIVISIVVFVIFYFLYKAFELSLSSLEEYYKIIVDQPLI